MNNAPTGRLITLDTFRGLAIVAMILVNNPGSWDHAYPQLFHAEWIGWTFTDLIFPCFLFIVGVAMWFSFASHSGDYRRDLPRKILLRATLIFLVGLFISWFPFYNLSRDNLYFAGVLQRIAVSYVIASTICILFGRKMIAVVATIMLLGYWLLIVQISDIDVYSKDAVFSQGLDVVSFRSCIASAVPIMIGYLVGSYIDRPKLDLRTILMLGGFGIAMTVIGKLWSFEFPIIKSSFWSSSYVVFATGISIIAFSVCLWIIENKNLKSWTTPFVHIGLNPLFIYAVSIILDKLTWIIQISYSGTSVPLHEWIFESLFRPLAGNLNGSLLYAVCFIFIHWLIAYGLFKRGIFIKV